MFGSGSAMPAEGMTPQMISVQGHPGHLTDTQEAALAKFKANLEKEGLYRPASQGEERATHDDTLLLRFLRARRFDAVKAQKLFSDRCAWEQKHDVLNLFANFPTDEFEKARRYYPRWTGRRDRYGRPLYVYKLSTTATALQKELSDVSAERRYQRIVALYEVMTRFIGPLCTVLPHPPHNTPVASVTTIIDLSNVSLRQMWNLRSHLQQASELANANYPETLGAVAVVNAPSFFATVWGWIKGWYDPATREKIRVLGSVGDDKSSTAANRALQELVERKNLPKEYGGEMEWTFYDEPDLDEDAKAAVNGALPKGPWIFDGLDRTVKRPKEYKGDDRIWPKLAPAPNRENGALPRLSEQTMVEAPTNELHTAKQTLTDGRLSKQQMFDEPPNAQVPISA